MIKRCLRKIKEIFGWFASQQEEEIDRTKRKSDFLNMKSLITMKTTNN